MKCIMRLINWKRIHKEKLIREFLVFDKEAEGWISLNDWKILEAELENCEDLKPLFKIAEDGKLFQFGKV